MAKNEAMRPKSSARAGWPASTSASETVDRAARDALKELAQMVDDLPPLPGDGNARRQAFIDKVEKL